jgi:hypothetical protein
MRRDSTCRDEWIAVVATEYLHEICASNERCLTRASTALQLTRGRPATVAWMDVDRLLRVAIQERRIVTFTLHGFRRRAEPHDYGVIGGVPKLFFYQVGGASRSGRPVGWRWAIAAEIVDLAVLDETFAGTRPTASGKHIVWDALFASVSRRTFPV